MIIEMNFISHLVQIKPGEINGFIAGGELYIPLSSDKTFRKFYINHRALLLYIPLSSDKTAYATLDDLLKKILYIPLSSDKTLLALLAVHL